MILLCENPTCAASAELPEVVPDGVSVDVDAETLMVNTEDAEGWTFNLEGTYEWLCPRCSRES